MTSGVIVVGPPTEVRRGATHWVGGYGAMLRWHLASLRLWIPTLVAIQVFSGVGFVLGIALFFRPIPISVALFVSTGVPVVNLLIIGLTLGPQLVATQRVEGSYEYLRCLPVSRSADALAWYTVTLVGGVPAVVVALAVAQARYDLPLHVSAMIVPAVLLTSFTGAMVGYAVAHAVSKATATRLVTQLLTFAVFSYAPVLYPVGRLPRWLGTLNWWLPFRQMAVAVRAALTSGPHPGLVTAYSALAVWAIVCATASAFVLGRRK